MAFKRMHVQFLPRHIDGSALFILSGDPFGLSFSKRCFRFQLVFMYIGDNLDINNIL